MKVIMYMAITANGYIAKANDDTSFISKKEWDSYSLMVRKIGGMIVGRRTYQVLTKQPEFKELKKVKIVVVSRKKLKTLYPHHLVAHSPKQALNKFKDFKTVVLAGGGLLNASFLGQNLVNEIYLDIEPIAFSNGIPLFKNGNFETEFKLLGTKQISPSEIQLHYQVK